MPFVIPYPKIDPVLVTIPFVDLPIRWYALAYLAGLFLGLVLMRRLMARDDYWPRDRAPLTAEQVEALLTWIVVGVILGGRLGFVFFYQPAYYLEKPSEILQVWIGGMSFHGGFLGVVLALLIFCRVHKAPVVQIGDAMAVVTPQALLLGRLANFINGELWGRPTDAPWAMVFPGGGPAPRHPSQLYEAALEGALLFALAWLLATRFGWLRKPGRMMAVFFIGYGAARSFVELFREADAQYITPDNPAGHVIRFGAEAGLTMGMSLSLPMIAVGLGVWIWSARRAR